MNLKELTIVEARAHMVKGTFSATDYVTELLRSEPDAVSLNAFVARDTGQMLKEAVAADASGASRNAAKLLAGIPIAFKDNINTTGFCKICSRWFINCSFPSTLFSYSCRHSVSMSRYIKLNISSKFFKKLILSFLKL
jgi:Asp-tRNA(Asn)/Glu-tRNA(Gln) amidotransferase A subunit family amidase